MKTDIFSVTEQLVRRQPGAALKSTPSVLADPQVSYVIDLNHSHDRAAVEVIKNALAS